MWHLCRAVSRPCTSSTSVLRIQQAVSYRIITPNTQRWVLFRNMSKLRKDSVEPQPPVNPRHPPGYVPPRPNNDANASPPVQSQSTIIARFRSAYAKYGKILLVVHFISSFGWFSGLLVLHFKGFDLGTYAINGLSHFHIITEERRKSFLRRMNEFSISGLLSRLPFLSQEQLERLNAFWTGERLRFLATTLLVYKLLAPVRYAFTLGVTTYVSRVFIRRGFIKRAPQGDTLQELYRDQKQLIKHQVRRAREQMKTSVRRGKHKSE